MFELSREEIQAREEKLESRIRKFQRDNFGARFEGASLHQVGVSLTQGAQELLQSWLKSRRNFLVFLGDPGTGKTYLASAILAYAFKHFNTVRYWKEEFLFNHLRNSIDQFGDYISTLQLAMDDEFCVIDDIGSTPVNDWRKEVVFNAMDIRYGTSLPTVVTSNLTRDQIAKKYEPRTADRIFAKENTIIELFNVPSLRSQGK